MGALKTENTIKSA